MVRIGPISSIFDYATFALMWFFFGAKAFGSPGSSPAAQASLVSLFQTGWFVESLLTQTLIVHIIRTRKIPFLQSHASGALLFATLVVMAIGIWLPFSPLAPLFWLCDIARHLLDLDFGLSCLVLIYYTQG